ncbi:hypothetical protein PRZ48_007721 [Zasmidium cellare]|uniref:Uncharacterized protein n=1 Tax=Zasmidium cellare TaxID=395010 RepID=A0ABR0EKA7_ZASCE|nr:hypothetical protein PRZ48_007721 [Zasmidium cellare]
MGRTVEDQDLEMSRRDEESLPLYSELGGAKVPTSIPEPTATPDDVRDFFKTLLVSKGQSSSEDAEVIAAKWKRGSGDELKRYPPHMYFNIFGHEDGWFLYKETKLIVKREKHGEGNSKHKRRGRIALAVMVAWEIAVISITVFSSDEVLSMLAFIGALLGVVGLIVAAAVGFGMPSLEDQVEAELRRCMETSRSTDDNRS